MAEPSSREGGFVAFFRRYTSTWVHKVAAAGLTAFGTLTFVDRWFALLAIGSYVLPPVVLYLRADRPVAGPTGPSGEDRGSRGGGTGQAADSRPGSRNAGPTGGSAAERDLEGADRSSSATATTAPSEGGRVDRSVEDGRMDGSSRAGRELGPVAADGRSTPDADSATVGWSTVDVPTDAALFDAAVVGDRAYAVGAGGVVLVDEGDGWTPLLEDGPGAAGNDLVGVDATAEGGAVWTAGDNGALARIDGDGNRHTDRSAPAGRTDNLSGVAVAGERDDETILLANGSGEVLRGRYRDGDLTWADPVKPGSGSSVVGVDLVDASVGACCDTNDGVFATEDGGAGFDRIGVDGADGTFADLAATATDDCLVAADDGVVHRYDGSTWTPERVCDASLSALARTPGRVTAVDGGGTIHEREADSLEWERYATGTDGALYGVAVGRERAVAVGADGTVVERDAG